MRLILLAGVALLASACGAYQFPAASPSASPPTGVVSGRVVAVPCVPAQPAGSTCAGRPVGGLELDYASGPAVEAKAVTDASGRYSVTLPGGTYLVTLQTYMRVVSGPPEVVVGAASRTVADYVLDSGIRVPVPQQ